MLTAQAVANRTNEDAADANVVDVTAAVNALVNQNNGTRWVPDPDDGEATVWADDTYLGALMYAARLVRRANSPAGIEAFFETGVAYVQRNDPDVAFLLRLGSSAVPMTG